MIVRGRGDLSWPNRGTRRRLSLLRFGGDQWVVFALSGWKPGGVPVRDATFVVPAGANVRYVDCASRTQATREPRTCGTA